MDGRRHGSRLRDTLRACLALSSPPITSCVGPKAGATPPRGCLPVRCSRPDLGRARGTTSCGRTATSTRWRRCRRCPWRLADVCDEATGRWRAGPPADWLPPLSTGQLVALRWNGSALHIEALDEDPQLFAAPLPPLRELMPLPEDLRPSDCGPGWDPEVRARIVEVPLPCRVHDELSRRADLTGERMPDYLSLLLGAAADRVQLAEPYRYERYEPYEGPYVPQGGDVVRLERWGR